MNKEQLAKKLHGQTYDEFYIEKYRAEANEDGLVIVAARSDDLTELDGAIYEEFGQEDGDSIYLDITEADYLLDQCCDTECKYYLQYMFSLPSIKISKDKYNIVRYKSVGFPSCSFNIMEDGGIYCEGIVFSIKDVPARTNP